MLTTILPLYDFARQVGGDAVEVRNLLPSGVEPHEYALSAGDVTLVAQADILIANGRGLDDFLTVALQKADALDRKPLNCSEAIAYMRESAGDPHMWLDPVLARQYVAKIAEEIRQGLLRSGKVEQAKGVASRAAAFDAELAVLDVEYRQKLREVRGAAFIAFHSAYGHLAARYDLRMAGVWEPSPGRQPGPRDVARLIDLARAKQVRVFFSEPGFSPRAVEMIAHDAHLPVRTLDPIETAENFETTHYMEKMRQNLDVMSAALTPERQRLAR